jgi:lipopolysaccharide export system permease protein
MLWRDISASVGFVAVAFLSLFFFIDFVDGLGDLGKNNRTLRDVLLAVALEVPGHLYELMPIAVLIGAIYSLSRMAQASEMVVLRTSGLSPPRALVLLSALGLGFAAVTFAIGDWAAPAAERQAALLQARLHGGLVVGSSGAWLKQREATPQGARSWSVNVRGTGPGGELLGVRIFEFDDNGALVARTEAGRAQVDAEGVWTLHGAQVARWPAPVLRGGGDDAAVEVQRHETLRWASTLRESVVAAAVLPLATMTTLELWRYSRHLSAQEQAAQAYEIRFWRKALYPLSCLVMLALALPFAYLHARAGSVSFKVFGGIMLGIAFVLLNNLSGHLGVLQDWTPWVAAATPSGLFLLLSLGAFTWLVRYR